MAGTPDVTDIGNGKTKALNKNDYLNMYINIRANQTFNDLVFKPKLEKGNKASSYSPYGMGSINEKISNKNVINIQPFTVTGGTTSYNGRDFTVNLKAGTYTLQRKYTKSSNAPSSAGMVQLKRNNVYYKNLDGGVASTIVELTEDTALTLSFYLSTSITSSSSSSIDFYDIQLEPGSTATPYVPHEEQYYSIFVQQPFRSIGDVRDCFVNKDGSWYERHYFGKLEQLLDLVGPVEQGFYFIPQRIKKEARLLSTHQQLGTKTASEEWQRFDGSQMKQLYPQAHNGVYINYKADTKREQIDWWNSLNNILLYELEEPLDLPCTEEQVEQLENLPSTYKDFTIIQSEDETEAYLEVSGIYDLNNLINN